ncbi:hypothetical protein LguiB_034689 [Lonicera macranthoides]
MFTTTKLAVEGSYHAPSSWIWSRAPWTVSAPAPTDRSSALITSCSDSPAPEITGPKVTTLKALNSSTLFSMSFAKKPKIVIVFKVSLYIYLLFSYAIDAF